MHDNIKKDLTKILYVSILFFFWFPPLQIIDITKKSFIIIKSLFLLFSIGIEIKTKIKKRYILIWIYSILVYLLTFIFNRGELLNSLVYITTILSIFYYFKNKENVKNINYFIIPATIFMIFTLYSICKIKGIPSLERSNKMGYFLGGKFKVGYLAILWEFLVLINLLKLNKKITFKYIFICFVILFLMNLKVNCVSGIVCSVILFCLLLLKDKIVPLLKTSYIFISTFILNLFTIFLYPHLKDLNIIHWIFNNIFQRKSTITGRTNIYINFFIKFKEEIIIGRGYNNKLVKEAIKYENAQNGFLHEMCRSGLLGMLTLGSIIFSSFKFSFYKIKNNDKLYIISWLFILVFICDSLIEISFNTYFFFILSICFSCDELEEI